MNDRLTEAVAKFTGVPYAWPDQGRPAPGVKVSWVPIEEADSEEAQEEA